MADALRIQVIGLRRWINGMRRLGLELEEVTRVRWEHELQGALEESQHRVHRVTGNLASTGRVETEAGGGSVQGLLAYGGMMGHGSPPKFVDYAVYEEHLHPFLRPSMEARLERLGMLGRDFERAVELF